MVAIKFCSLECSCQVSRQLKHVHNSSSDRFGWQVCHIRDGKSQYKPSGILKKLNLLRFDTVYGTLYTNLIYF
eukprot:scaffold17_cov131-Skeletonema_menzelii.AAC.3